MSKTIEVIERIRYHETDVGGKISERGIFYLLDSARGEFFRDNPGLVNNLKNGDISFRTLNVSLNISADHETDYDDEVVITARIEILEKGVIHFDYRIRNVQTGLEFAYGKSEHCFTRDNEVLGEHEIRDYLK